MWMCRRLGVLAVLATGLLVCPPGGGRAGAEEVAALRNLHLRLETGKHIAAVRSISVANSGLFATGSDDKTVRLWDPGSGRSVRTIRLPLADGNEGMVRAVALSPDGRFLLATGATGPAWNGPGRYSINLFDLDADGRELKRIPNLDAVVDALAFDAAGQSFVAGFAGRGGVVMWRMDGTFVGRDAKFKGDVTGLDVAADNRVAAVGDDGTVRVYDGNLKPLHAVTLKAKPASVAFSPDGGLLAVGTTDAGVYVLSTDGLATVRQLRPPAGITGDLAKVTWARMDRGVHLLASGGARRADVAEREIVAIGWRDMGFGSAYLVPLSRDSVTALRGLPQGGAAFVGAAPVVGTIGGDRTVAFANGGDLLDFRDVYDGRFGISGDGLSVEFGTEFGGADPLLFSLTPTGGTLEAAAAEPTLAPPLLPSSASPLKEWRNGRPVFGKRPLEIPIGESSRSITVLPGNNGFLLGTDGQILLFSPKGDLIKAVRAPATVWGLVAAPEAPLAVAALGDGTLRWYSLRPERMLEELAAVFVHSDRERWIAWTPAGVFAQSSFGGNDLVGYAKLEGERRQPEWITFAQLFRVFYKPRLVHLNVTDPDTAGPEMTRVAANADPARVEPPQVDLVQLCFTPPGAGGAEQCQPFQEARTRSFRRPAASAPASAVDTPADGSTAAPALGQITLPPGVETVRLTIRTTVAAGQEARELDVLVNGRNVGRSATRSFRRVPPPTAAQPSAGPSTQQPALQTPLAETPEADIRYEISREIRLDGGDNTVQVRAYASSQLYGTTEARLFAPPVATAAERGGRPTLYVVAIGVNQYADPAATDLGFATPDARSFAETVKARSGTLYGDVRVVARYETEVTAEGVRTAFAEVAAAARPDDAVLVYLAGHGMSQPVDGKDTYLFLPHDARTADPAANAVTGDALVRYMADIQARNLMLLLDTCFAGAFDTSFDPGASMSEESGRILVTAANSVETALDSINDVNGVFAYVVLDGLNGKAALPGDSSVDAGILTRYLVNNVSRIALKEKNHVQHVTTHQRSSAPFPVAAVSSKDPT